MKPEDPALYHDVEDNTLLNDVFFYVLHHRPQLQNMHEYMVLAQADTDPRVMEAFVQRKYTQLPGPPHGPPVQLVSRNLLAYLETLVAFSPYYRADGWEDGDFPPASSRPLQRLPGSSASPVHHREADCLVPSTSQGG
jgi:hypothetical protein